MPSTARKVAISDIAVDINEASADDLRHALPGVGEVLAQRIVAYREQHGPFSQPEDLLQIAGVSERRLSKFAPRLSVAPALSGFRMQPAPPSVPTGATQRPYAIESEPLPIALAPSMSSLLPSGPEEVLRAPGSPHLAGPPTSAPRAAEHTQGASAPPDRSAPKTAAPAIQASAAADEFLSLPLERPLRLMGALAAIALLSAVFGAIFGIRSSGGTEQLEGRVGRVEVHVGDLAGSVKALEGQASTFAESINLLDSRLSERTPALDASPVEGPAPRARTGSTVVHDEARGRVRQALRELDPVAAARRLK